MRSVEPLTEAPDLEQSSAEEVLAYLADRFHPRLYVACSFQKEASVIMDMLLKIEPEARFFTLDTGLLFPETYETWRQVEKRYGVKVDVCGVGDTVKVTGTSVGHGFQGVVKRHGIGGGPNTHGNTKHRRPGSIGPGTDPSRVIKGKKMPGHYGDARHTQTHLRVEKIDAERNLIYVRGSVAGKPGGVVVVRKLS